MDRSLEILGMSDKKLMLEHLYKTLHPSNKTLTWKMWNFYSMELLNFTLLILLILKIGQDAHMNFFQLSWILLATNETDAVFPKRTLCYLTTSLQERDFLCAVHINYLSETIFQIFCVWILVLLTAGTFNMFYTAVWTLFPAIQKWTIKRSTDQQRDMNHICEILPLGNRWLLIKVSVILPAPLYEDLLQMLDKLEEGPYGDWTTRSYTEEDRDGIPTDMLNS